MVRLAYPFPMIWHRLERFRDFGLLILRLGFGFGFFWFHGLPKLTADPERWARTGSAIGSLGIDFAPAAWGLAAGIAEGVGGILFALGLLFRPVALAMLAVMIVATTNHFVTGQGTPAHAFKNAWVLAGILFVGPGRYSLDHLLARRRRIRR